MRESWKETRDFVGAEMGDEFGECGKRRGEGSAVLGRGRCDEGEMREEKGSYRNQERRGEKRQGK